MSEELSDFHLIHFGRVTAIVIADKPDSPVDVATLGAYTEMPQPDRRADVLKEWRRLPFRVLFHFQGRGTAVLRACQAFPELNRVKSRYFALFPSLLRRGIQARYA